MDVEALRQIVVPQDGQVVIHEQRFQVGDRSAVQALDLPVATFQQLLVGAGEFRDQIALCALAVFSSEIELKQHALD